MAIKKTLLLSLTTGAIALSATPAFSQYTAKNSLEFDCKPIGGILTTTATVTKDGKTKEEQLIHWHKKYFEPEDNIETACKESAKLFKYHYVHQKNLYVQGENQAEKIVICLINIRGESCNSKPELFRLNTKKHSDFHQALSEILDSKNLATIKSSELRGRDSRTYSRLKFWQRFWRG